ncbi:1852_t:CDS:1, partial [Acaulospora colombiana]
LLGLMLRPNMIKLGAELKSRIEELEKGRTDTVAENARCHNAISKLKAKVVKLRDDNVEGKQFCYGPA